MAFPWTKAVGSDAAVTCRTESHRMKWNATLQASFACFNSFAGTRTLFTQMITQMIP